MLIKIPMFETIDHFGREIASFPLLHSRSFKYHLKRSRLDSTILNDRCIEHRDRLTNGIVVWTSQATTTSNFFLNRNEMTTEHAFFPLGKTQLWNYPDESLSSRHNQTTHRDLLGPNNGLLYLTYRWNNYACPWCLSLGPQRGWCIVDVPILMNNMPHARCASNYCHAPCLQF